MNNPGSLSEHTTHCPCDSCFRVSICMDECKPFKRYSSACTVIERKELLAEFVKLQDLTAKHYRRFNE